MAETIRGGCFCGAVRFELSEIFDAGYCHCSICRRFHAAPVVAWANAPGHAFRVTSGEPEGFESSDHWKRYFCGRCGTPVFGRHPKPGSGGEDLVCVYPSGFDDPGAVRPSAHVWCGSGLADFEIADDLPRFAAGELPHPSKRRPPRPD